MENIFYKKSDLQSLETTLSILKMLGHSHDNPVPGVTSEKGIITIDRPDLNIYLKVKYGTNY